MSEPELDFEKTLAELEDLSRRLDDEGLDLDEAISLFERGVARLKDANRWLDEAQGRVEEVIAAASGRLETRPLDPGSAETEAAVEEGGGAEESGAEWEDAPGVDEAAPDPPDGRV